MSKTDPPSSKKARIDRRVEWVTKNRVLRWTLLVLFVIVTVLTILFAILLAWPDAQPTSSTNCSTVTTFGPAPSPTETIQEDDQAPALEPREMVQECNEKSMPAWVIALGPVLMLILIAPELMSYYAGVVVKTQVGDVAAEFQLLGSAADEVTEKRVDGTKRSVKRRVGDFKQEDKK